MRYDTIIIGGGLGGLMSGIVLARAGERVAIITSGKSALHFCSGSMELWAGSEESLREVACGASSHPYAKVGYRRMERYSQLATDIFSSAGIGMVGEFGRKHYRLSPIGVLKPSWLTMKEFATFDDESLTGCRRVTIVGIEGYLDFYPEFIAEGLTRRGVECRVESITLREIADWRESAADMRTVALSRLLSGEAIERLAEVVRPLSEGADMVLLPALFGMGECDGFDRLCGMLEVPVRVVPTMSASIPGIRAQKALMEEFVRLGGEYIMGDTVVGCSLDGGRVVSLRTANNGDEEFIAHEYILATGSFFSRGLKSTPEGVSEPLLGLDLTCVLPREQWCAEHILDRQPFQSFGVAVDEMLHPSIAGERVTNLYVVGSVLGGADAVKEGCGAGVVIMTALRAAEEIVMRKEGTFTITNE